MQSITDTTLQSSFPLQPAKYYAAVDLGSNTCRLLIAKKEGLNFTTQEVLSKIVRLGQGLSKNHTLSKEAIQRALSVLQQYARRIREYNPIEICAVATEACRQALNAEDFMRTVYQQTGLKFLIIDQAQEAFYVAKGCSALADPKIPYAVFFDIGGGSTEVIWAQIRFDHTVQVLASTSVPYGVVNLAEAYNMQSAVEYKNMQSEVYERVLSFVQQHGILSFIERQEVQLISTSGTATTIAALNMGLRLYDRRKIDGTRIEFKYIEAITKQVQLMSTQERIHHPCIGNERSELILGGMAILSGICDAIPVETLHVADRGVRDGIVAYLAYGHQPAPDHRQLETVSSVA